MAGYWHQGVPPDANAKQAMKELHAAISTQQTAHPEGAFIAAGDFKHSNLKSVLPKFYQHVSCPTRGDRIRCTQTAYTTPTPGSIWPSFPAAAQIHTPQHPGVTHREDCKDLDCKDTPQHPGVTHREDCKDLARGCRGRSTAWVSIQSNQKPWMNKDIRLLLKRHCFLIRQRRSLQHIQGQPENRNTDRLTKPQTSDWGALQQFRPLTYVVRDTDYRRANSPLPPLPPLPTSLITYMPTSTVTTTLHLSKLPHHLATNQSTCHLATNQSTCHLAQAVVYVCLKTTRIVPVLKESTPECLSDYRLVALTPIITSMHTVPTDRLRKPLG